MLRRSSSFKRAVRSRSAASANEQVVTRQPTSTKVDGGGTHHVAAHITGNAFQVTGKKSKPVFAVLYCGPRSATCSLHKSVRDYTAFRAFPEETYTLPYSSNLLVEKEENALRISLNGLPLLVLAFEGEGELERWRVALLKDTDADARAAEIVRAKGLANQAAAVAAATEREQRASQQRAAVKAKLQSIAATKEALAALTKQIESVRSEYDAMVDRLQFETSGVELETTAVPRNQLRDTWVPPPEAMPEAWPEAPMDLDICEQGTPRPC